MADHALDLETAGAAYIESVAQSVELSPLKRRVGRSIRPALTNLFTSQTFEFTFHLWCRIMASCRARPKNSNANIRKTGLRLGEQIGCVSMGHALGVGRGAARSSSPKPEAETDAQRLEFQ